MPTGCRSSRTDATARPDPPSAGRGARSGPGRRRARPGDRSIVRRRRPGRRCLRRLRRRLEAGRGRSAGCARSSFRRRRTSPRGSCRPGPTGRSRRTPGRRSSRSSSGSPPAPAPGSWSATSLARSRLVERLLSPYLVAAQAIPILALAPLLALWFGPGPAGQGHHLRPDRLLPGGDRDDGRDPLGRRSACSSSADRSGRPAARSSSTLEIPAALPSILGGLRVGRDARRRRRDRRRVGGCRQGPRPPRQPRPRQPVRLSR